MQVHCAIPQSGQFRRKNRNFITNNGHLSAVCSTCNRRFQRDSAPASRSESDWKTEAKNMVCAWILITTSAISIAPAQLAKSRIGKIHQASAGPFVQSADRQVIDQHLLAILVQGHFSHGFNLTSVRLAAGSTAVRKRYSFSPAGTEMINRVASEASTRLIDWIPITCT